MPGVFNYPLPQYTHGSVVDTRMKGSIEPCKLQCTSHGTHGLVSFRCTSRRQHLRISCGVFVFGKHFSAYLGLFVAPSVRLLFLLRFDEVYRC
jgi:hypothetical protein